MSFLKYNNKLIKYNNKLLSTSMTPPDPEKGYWIHKTTGVKTEFDLSADFINGTELNRPSWADDALELFVPEGIEEIGEQAFMNCQDLQTVTFPESLQGIKFRAFHHTDRLKNIYLKSVIPPRFDAQDGFMGNLVLEEFQVKVPAESYDAYRIANRWVNFEPSMVVLNNLVPGSRVHSGYTSTESTKRQYADQSNILIENVHFTNITETPISFQRCDNIIIRNCKFSNNSDVRTLNILNSSNIIIYNCDFDTTGGINIENPSSSVRVFSNDFSNVRVNNVNSSNIILVSTIEDTILTGKFLIQDNAFQGEHAENISSSNVVVRSIKFSSTTPALIRNNWFKDTYNGDGKIIILIPAWEDMTVIAENVWVLNNIIVNSGGGAIQSQVTSNITVNNNIAFHSSARIGIGIRLTNPTDQVIRAVQARNNRVKWIRYDGLRNEFGYSENSLPIDGIETNIVDETLNADILPNNIIGQ